MVEKEESERKRKNQEKYQGSQGGKIVFKTRGWAAGPVGEERRSRQEWQWAAGQQFLFFPIGVSASLISRQAPDNGESAGGQGQSEPAREDTDPNSNRRPETHQLKLAQRVTDIAKLRKMKLILCRKYSKDCINQCHCALTTSGKA